MTETDVLVRLRGGPGAFDGGSWTIRRGEQWVVRGANRAGKTYLGRIVSGELPPGAASLQVSESVEDDIALVTFSQQEELAARSWLQARWHAGIDAPAETVGEFLSYETVHDINPFAVQDGDAGRRRACARKRRAVVRQLQLAPLLPRRLVQLSNGEIRKILIARALLRSPSLLILDDPFAGLDTASRQLLHRVIGELASNGLPMIIMVRHADEIPLSTTHVLTLRNMRIASKRRCTSARVPLRGTAARIAPAKGSAGAAGTPVIEMRDVTVRYGRRVVIDRLSWTVLEGDKWLLTGPNGSGKTTLFSLVTGDNPAAYAQEIRVFGRERRIGEPLWAIRRRIGHVSPELQCHFNPETTCLDAALSGWVDTYGQRMRIGRAERQTTLALLGEMGFANEALRPMAALTPGQARLVLVARALLPGPELLLLDEPCLNLDTRSRRYLLKKLAGLFRSGVIRTVVCTAHHPDDVPEGMNRVLALGEAGGEGRG